MRGFRDDDLPRAEPNGVLAAGQTEDRNAIADYGSITVESRPGGDELVSLYPPNHIVVLEAEDIVPDAETAFERFEAATREAGANGGSGATRVLATGSSATADMGELVSGVHGPKTVHIVVIES